MSSIDQSRFRFIPCTELHDARQLPHGRLVDTAYSHGEKCDQGGALILALDGAEALLEQLLECGTLSEETCQQILKEAREHGVPERIVPSHLTLQQYLMMQSLGNRVAHRRMMAGFSLALCFRGGIFPF